MAIGSQSSASTNVWVDNLAQTVTALDVNESADDLFEDYIRNGVNPEITAFEMRLTASSFRRTKGANVWEFIADAVNGSGGFSNGAYLFPFALEYDEVGIPTKKYLDRQQQADYDNFAQHICNTPWDVIVGSADLVERDAKEGTPEGEWLNAFWDNCDGRGTQIMDFLEFPHLQARQFGTGIIIMDRPPAKIVSQADNKRPENRPYVYAVPTRNVVHWQFGEDGQLSGIIILDPQTDADTRKEFTDYRVWTRAEWAVYRRESDATTPVQTSSGRHGLGEVPVVACYNALPTPKRLLGHTEMLDIARLAQTVYNIDSEAREIERKCSTVLTIPVKSADTYVDKRIVLGTDSALLYDSEAGKPEWLSPDLAILKHLDDRREGKKRDGYQMAGLGALAVSTGTVKTSSGYHAEVEFNKTERRIARHAAMLETVEKRLGRLYLRYLGVDTDAQDDLFSITYPRDYGIRDLDKLVDRSIVLLEENLGETWDTKTLSKVAKAQFPRLNQDDIDAMVAEAVKNRSAARKLSQQASRVSALAAGVQAVPPPAIKPDSRMTSDHQTAAGGGQASPDA
jgi:hypothetical protein